VTSGAKGHPLELATLLNLLGLRHDDLAVVVGLLFGWVSIGVVGERRFYWRQTALPRSFRDEIAHHEKARGIKGERVVPLLRQPAVDRGADAELKVGGPKTMSTRTVKRWQGNAA